MSIFVPFLSLCLMSIPRGTWISNEEAKIASAASAAEEEHNIQLSRASLGEAAAAAAERLRTPLWCSR